MDKVYSLIWQVPFGEFALKLDFLGLVFLAAIAVLVVCAGIYGIGYMLPYKEKKPLGFHFFFYFILAIALVLIVLANNVILFLGAWEAMTLSVYFLILFHDEKPSTRKAGFLYLIAGHCGTFLLFLMFFLMAQTAGSMNFDVMSRASFPPALAGLIFLLALPGFGVKAGFLPVHIWLPHAHPAAPSQVSALLSGVAIKTGIYGICRILWILGVVPDWCGYVLLIIGVVSGVMGVLYALGQHELKRLLAYHSIENIGIIAIGLGLGLLGRSHNLPFIAALGFGGALLHVINHALFKGLLFLGAGTVIQRTHTGEMDQLGGLAKVMPLTSVLFLIGALSICGLPLFNGFISEFFIYFGLFQGLMGFPLNGVIACGLGILALALMGALALACFTKVFGTVFLGEPRSAHVPAKTASGTWREETSPWMLLPMIALAGLCSWIGLAPLTASRLAFSGGEYLMRLPAGSVDFAKVFVPLAFVISLAFVFIALALALILIRRFLLGPLPMPVGGTWACGYSKVGPRSQYTSASFVGPIMDAFKYVLLFRKHGGQVTGEFPGKTHVSTAVHDASEETVFSPFFTFLMGLSKKFDENRIRYTQIYLMYIFVFLIFLLVWKIR